MSRHAEPTPPGARARCTAGFHGHSCKKRTCSICGLVWAKDWRVVLFANLKHLGGFVMLSSVTPPGKEALPGTRGTARMSAPTSMIRSGLVVVSTRTPWRSGPTTPRRGGNDFTTPHGTRSSGGTAVPAVDPACVGAAEARPGARASGVQRADTRGRRCSRRRTSRSSAGCARHGFGFVGRKRGVSQQVMAADRAAAYLSSYFVTGKREKATLAENAKDPNLPRLLIWLTPTLTRQTGMTMRSRRRCPAAMGRPTGLLPPVVVGLELARAILLAERGRPSAGP